MAAHGVIPSGPKTDQHFPFRLQELVHYLQYLRGVAEMLKSVHGDDNVGKFLSGRNKMTNILYSAIERLLSRRLQDLLTVVNADHPFGSASGDLYRVGSLAAAKIDDDFPLYPRGKVIAH